MSKSIYRLTNQQLEIRRYVKKMRLRAKALKALDIPLAVNDTAPQEEKAARQASNEKIWQRYLRHANKTLRCLEPMIVVLMDAIDAKTGEPSVEYRTVSRATLAKLRKESLI